MASLDNCRITSKDNLFCGYKSFLQDCVDSNVNPYEDYLIAVKDVLDNPDFEITPKELPVVFHVIYDDIEMLYPGGGDTTNLLEMDFDVTYILSHINEWFSATGISFVPALTNPTKEVLIIPGLNLIDGSSVVQVRNGVTNKYIEDLVVPRQGAGGALATGITTDHLATTYSWDTDKYINIFLVNRIKSKTNSSNRSYMSMLAPNPILLEALGEENKYAAFIELWAIGASFYKKNGDLRDKGESALPELNPGSTNYGYMYMERSSNGDNYPSYTFNSSISPFSGFRSRARTIAHCLGHMLGLGHPTDTFAQQVTMNATCLTHNNESLPLTGVFGDSIEDSSSSSRVDGLIEASHFTQTNYCGDGTFADTCTTHMHSNQFSGSPGTEIGGLGQMFTEGQVRWMHANFELTTEDGDGNIQPSLPARILASHVPTSTVDPEPVHPCDMTGRVERIAASREVRVGVTFSDRAEDSVKVNNIIKKISNIL